MNLKLSEERKLWRKGYTKVVGLDESGRGPLAGPVVATAVAVLNPKSKARNPKQFLIRQLADKFQISNLKEIKDSKKLSAKKRKEIYKNLLKNPAIKWATGRVSERVIDKINILEASKLAMKRAVYNLSKKISSPKIDFLILDGNFKIDLDISQKSIVKADEKVFSCIAAGIIAKVTRDRKMQREHKKYPQYGFDKHKGYPTKEHIKMLKKYGPCEIHRTSFKPVKTT